MDTQANIELKQRGALPMGCKKTSTIQATTSKTIFGDQLRTHSQYQQWRNNNEDTHLSRYVLGVAHDGTFVFEQRGSEALGIH